MDKHSPPKSSRLGASPNLHRATRRRKREAATAPLHAMSALAISALLAACGGGDLTEPPKLEVPQASAAALRAKTVGWRKAAPSSDPATLAAPDPVEGTSSTVTSSTPTLTTAGATTYPTSETQVLAPGATLVLVGTKAQPTATPAATTFLRTFYVDSRIGSDEFDGTAAGAAGAGIGPWRTFARVLRSGLKAGDRLVLACGSTWNETLRLPGNGTLSSPVLVTAPSGGCGSSSLPTIDGSVSIPATAWTRFRGDIYSTKADITPLSLNGSGVNWTEAHHPNRGYLAADPTTPYLTLAADSPVIDVAGRPVSKSLAVGSDLVLPEGATLDGGARARIRINDWYIDELQVTSSDKSFIYLKDPTRYPARKGWGYFLLGQLWMVDSQGEWSYDTSTRTLYAQIPTDPKLLPAIRVATLQRGIDLEARSFVEVRGVAIRNAGVGVWMRNANSVKISNSTLNDITGSGVDVGGSTNVTIESNSFNRTGGSAIDGGGGPSTRASTGLSAINNRVRDSAVAMGGDTVLSLPTNATAAILAGDATRATKNVVENSAYLGIRVGSNSIVENNMVRGACTILDDGAGIYTWNSANVQIRNNIVLNTRGNIQGKSPGSYTRTNGIYLDESVRASLVEGNTVVDADHGIFLHVSSGNTIRGNRLYANHRSQLRLAADRNKERVTGDLYDNVVESNEFSPVTPESAALLLENSFGDTSSFGTFDKNRYADRVATSLVVENANRGKRTFSFATWRSVTVGLPPTRDPNGSAISDSGYANYSIGGTSIVPNGSFETDAKGWNTWNEKAPIATLLRERCERGWCLRVVAGGSPTVVSSSYFGIRAGQWYRLSLDIQTDTDNQPVQLIVRRGSGGSNPYAPLMDRPLSTTGGTSWLRHSIVFQAIDTAEPIDKPSQGARLDFEGIVSGRSVRFANVEILPIAPQGSAAISSILVSSNPTPVQQGCVFSSVSVEGICDNSLYFTSFSKVSWPTYLSPWTGTIMFSQDKGLVDLDRDGIPDSQDRCPNTAIGAAVNGAGCALGQ